MTVRTRFAPSPTGYLHIGGVRTALFNWLLARQAGGQFLLRIDDTDENRNVAEALQPILDGFRWLGIDWDEGPEIGGPHAPYYQSQRQRTYCEAVERLLETGAAYRDFARPEELQAERASAEAAGIPYVASRRWEQVTAADGEKFTADERESVVRLKMPREGVCRFDDLVRGPMQIEWAQESDHVVQRADGTCLYHLANVVDDHAFEITHVVRAVEHLANTPRQIFIAQALGYPLPIYAHLPFVAEPGSKNKLSKRKLDKYLKHPDFRKVHEHGARILEKLGQTPDPATFNPVIVDFYREVGYLPSAILNYLLLLGWSLDDRTEDFSREEMIRSFSLERVVKAAASFDAARGDPMVVEMATQVTKTISDPQLSRANADLLPWKFQWLLWGMRDGWRDRLVYLFRTLTTPTSLHTRRMPLPRFLTALYVVLVPVHDYLLVPAFRMFRKQPH